VAQSASLPAMRANRKVGASLSSTKSARKSVESGFQDRSTVIRSLLRNIREEPYFGESIGVDDWAYRKGQSYGTLICDTQTGKAIALLPGRDGSALKDWLRNNKQIKTVTRDRASAYASAIAEVIPQAGQIADRFHLFQNLLLAIKDTVKTVIPERIRVQSESGDNEEEDKKNCARIQFLV